MLCTVKMLVQLGIYTDDGEKKHKLLKRMCIYVTRDNKLEQVHKCNSL